ncbi:class I SAM-dependent methyltransferase [Nocardia puris]|uniref:class I SAM-dependent DNA methyltransferase n=1 Tax=Nocardia puris TaxID=208602 RepID=UPI001896335E|nr:class I SAM-dependent methyltransferase [Nocardia puris]MBF6214790.1 class I SAM-dependent methyltransferase [Nocardia puris]
MTAGTSMHLYGRALAGEPCWVRCDDGRTRPLPVRRWLGATTGDELADDVLTRWCDGPTIDLGCGPGRLAARLTGRGVAALGVDLSPIAVAITRSRGAPALQRDLFGPLPGHGRWHYALLADGNLGIGGDPARMLRRVRDLLAPGGVAVVEFEPAGTGMVSGPIRLETHTAVGDWFPWAHVGIEHVPDLAAVAGLEVLTTTTVSDRPIAWLTHARPR